MLHFALLAGLLFLVNHLMTQAQKQEIVVSGETVDFLVQQREDLELKQLSDVERQQVIDQFVEDEILYSEAYKRGLDRGDSRMRRNLILKMRGLLGGEVEPPDEATLRAWYRDNTERFMQPENWTLEQVFFSDASQVPADLQVQLRAGLDPNTVGEDRLDFRRHLPRASQRELAAQLGPDVARAILAVNDARWYGPVESTYGVHFFRVTGYEAAQQQSFESIRGYLEGLWMLEQSRQRIEAEIDALSDQYEIIVETVESP